MKYTIKLGVGDIFLTIIEAANFAEAESKARQWVQDLGLGSAARQVGCTISDEEGEQRRIKVVLGGSGVPGCKLSKLHAWRSPHTVVGGSVANPGVSILGEKRLRITEGMRELRRLPTQDDPGRSGV